MCFSCLKFSGTTRVLSHLWTVLPQTVSSMLKLLLTLGPLTEHQCQQHCLTTDFRPDTVRFLRAAFVVLCQQGHHYALRGNTLVSRTHTHTHSAVTHVTVLIKVTIQATNPSCEIMSVLLASAIMDLGHSQENLDTLIFRMDWIKGLDESI